MAEEKKLEEAQTRPTKPDMFYNPHDIIGIKGMISAQSKELDRKMVFLTIFTITLARAEDRE